MTVTHRPFRFGVQVLTSNNDQSWIDTARQIESLGYSTMTMPDHFDRQLAPMPALQAAADATSTLRIGALVFDNDYKHPVVLAKELATMDVLSGGRVEVGIGAGWMRTDYQQSGIVYDPPGVRVSRFIEAIDVIRGAFSSGSFDYDGEYYQIEGYDGYPKPIQTRVPLLIGGGGPRVLKFAARMADIIGINPNLRSGAIDAESIASMTQDEFDSKVEIVRAEANRVGRLADIEINLRCFFVSVTNDAAGTAEATAKMLGVDPQMVSSSPYALIGTTDQIVERLVEIRERWGPSYIIVGANEFEAFAPIVAKLADT